MRNLFQNRNTGTTSAHAENTPAETIQPFVRWNYLRARGEYFTPMSATQKEAGTTSAHAENTLNELGLL